MAGNFNNRLLFPYCFLESFVGGQGFYGGVQNRDGSNNTQRKSH